MNRCLLSLLCSCFLLGLSACHKEFVANPQPPAADEANNVCVMSVYLGTNERSPRCESSAFTDVDGQNAVTKLEDALIRGTDGEKYAVLDGGYQLYNHTTCHVSEGSDLDEFYGTYGLLAWVKYDCRGAGVNTVVFGPYLTTSLDQKTDELKAQVLASNPGYEIAYIGYEQVSGTNLSYIEFYIYQPSAVVNAEAATTQQAVIQALKEAKTFNRMTFNPNRSLSDTLTVATHLVPGSANSASVQFAHQMLDVQSQMLKSTQSLLDLQKLSTMKGSTNMLPASQRVPLPAVQ